MRINGKNAVSGTLVIGPGEKGYLVTPFVTAELAIDPHAPDGMRLKDQTTANPKFELGGAPSPMGAFYGLDLTISNGANIHLNIAVYTIGDNTNSAYVVHYTYY